MPQNKPHPGLFQHVQNSTGNSIDSVTVKGITLSGWTIESHRGSIADSKTIEESSSSWGIPLPEMPFDKNRLLIKHEASGWTYQFDAMQALRSIDGVDEKVHTVGIGPPLKSTKNVFGHKPNKSKRVKVAHASEWEKKRDNSDPIASSSSSSGNSSSNFGSDVAVAAANGSIPTARDYDWTYSCTWPGGEVSQPSQWKSASEPARDRIPLERLGPPTTPGAKPEPILFYDDIVLYEDELGDNGCSMLGVKVRVMPSGFLVLQRFFLRVDNVVFRIFDTRMYVGFDDEKRISGRGSSSDDGGGDATTKATEAMSTMSLQKEEQANFRVIRECSGCQAKYIDIKARLPPYKPNDLSPLTDAGWVSQQLDKIQREKQRGLPQLQDMPRPAVLPSLIATGQESNRILGEIIEEDKWEGEGQWVDVILLH